jgi:diaminohydroxyphosphoribosylaminopyrimidine deaminase/5-amino-6-(5-phosphoribosylamino)uracil reductase
MNNKYMQLSIDKAWRYQLLTYPNPAVGATVVKNGKVLSTEAHKKAGMPHAEVLALKSAYLTQYKDPILEKLETSLEIHNYLIKNHKNFFKECEIYVTLEPCNHIGKTPACAMLLEAVGIKKVSIGTMDCNNEATGGLQRLRNANIEVEIDVCKAQTDELLYPFRKWQQNSFLFFKIAMREDGTVDGGYITTKDSLKLVHEIRNSLDLLVIGGETVRIDRPTLDSRFSSINNPPNILIYSNRDDFDTTMPLFLVPNREVKISNNIKIIKDNKFVMVEGGYNLLNSLKSQLDYLVIFSSNKTKSDRKIDTNKFGFIEVYRYKINENDTIIFLKKKESL